MISWNKKQVISTSCRIYWWCLTSFLRQKILNQLLFLIFCVFQFAIIILSFLAVKKRCVLCIRPFGLLFGHKHLESRNDLNLTAVKQKPVKSAKHYSLMLDSTWNMNLTKQMDLFKPIRKTRWKNKGWPVTRKEKTLRSELTETLQNPLQLTEVVCKLTTHR